MFYISSFPVWPPLLRVQKMKKRWGVCGTLGVSGETYSIYKTRIYCQYDQKLKQSNPRINNSPHLIITEKERIFQGRKSFNNNVIMITTLLIFLFSPCPVSSPFLSHTFPASLGPKVNGFILVVVVKWGYGQLSTSGVLLLGGEGCSQWWFPLHHSTTHLGSCLWVY